MAELPLFDKDGNKTGTVAVDEKAFGDKVRKRLLHQVVIAYEANRRQGTASTKTRGQVKGSTRKPWPQKHTGMARAGSIRSPLWRHGGVTFGPKPRDYRLGLTRSMREAALNSALLAKIKDQEVGIIEDLQFEKPGTKRTATLLGRAGLDRTVLVGTHRYDRNVWLSFRNLRKVTVQRAQDFNAYDVLKHRNLLLTREALGQLLAARKGEA